MAADPGPVFSALADETRRALLRQIVAQGPVTATQLTVGQPISRQAVAKHLAVLDEAGLISGSRRGREVRYLADPAPLVQARSWIDDTAGAWDVRLSRLADLVHGAPSEGPENSAPKSRAQRDE